MSNEDVKNVNTDSLAPPAAKSKEGAKNVNIDSSALPAAKSKEGAKNVNINSSALPATKSKEGAKNVNINSSAPPAAKSKEDGKNVRTDSSAPPAVILENAVKETETTGSLCSFIKNRYLNIVLGHPWKVVLTTLTISFALVAISVSLYHHIFDFDPTQGFETRGTTLANAVLTMGAIMRTAASKMDIMLARGSGKTRKIRQANPFKVDQGYVEKVVHSNESGIYSYTRSRTIKHFTIKTTPEPISMDYGDDYGVNSAPHKRQINFNVDFDPCFQYGILGGTRFPYRALEALSKIILEVEDNKLFTLNVFRKLCEVDKIIDAVLTRSVHKIKPGSIKVKHSFNLPHYSNCLNFLIPSNCSALNQQNIHNLKNAVNQCRRDPSLPECRDQLMAQVLNYLLPRSKSDNKHIAILLKVPTRHQLGIKGQANRVKFYKDLLNSLQDHFPKSIILKGADFSIRDEEFLDALNSDFKIALISAALVLLCFFLYTRSIFYTIIIAMVIVLSMGVAFFFYAVVFRIKFLPSLNTLAVALMIAVGADDAFLLMVYFKKFRKSNKEPSRIGKPGVTQQNEHDRVIRAIRISLQHSLVSMFVTSATTAVAFISNLTSVIIVLRCFGVYACLTVMVNFTYVVFLLPSAMAICCSERQRNFLPEIDIASKVSHCVYLSRFAILAAGVTAAAGAIIIVFVNPGLKVPRYNPVKVLPNSHPYEWFDNNRHLFNFEWQRGKFIKNYIIGIDPISDTSYLDPYKSYYLPNKANGLTFTQKNIESLQVNIAMLVKKPFPGYESWLDGFLSSNITCKDEEVIEASCLLQFAAKIYSPFNPDYAETPSDGPIFDKNYRLRGYYITTLSNKTVARDSKVLEAVAQEIEANCKKMIAVGDLPKMCLTSPMAMYYDVIATFPSTTLYSVIISVAACLIVVILCTRRLILSLIAAAVVCCVMLWTIAVSIMSGWELSIGESTILILTIGLSFDFTLHVAVSFRDTKGINFEDRIRPCLSSAGRACVLGATTSILCGLPLIFGNTAVFTQVGSLLIILGAMSLFGALLVFPAALACYRSFFDVTLRVFYSSH